MAFHLSSDVIRTSSASSLPRRIQARTTFAITTTSLKNITTTSLDNITTTSLTINIINMVGCFKKQWVNTTDHQCHVKN